MTNFDAVEPPAPTLDGLIRNLEQASRDAPQDETRLAMQRELRFLYLLGGQRDKALEPIPGLDSREQEFLANELYALSLYLDEQRNPDRQRRAAEAVVPHTEAAIKLSEQASLRVHNLAFCTEVNSYGVYTRFPKERFHPGQQVLLYAEVENFVSERTPKGHHTRLEGSFQLFDHRNDQRAEKRFPVAEEHCHNRRRDYFVRYFLEVPSDLPDGRYTLKLTIEDLLGKKVGESSIEFEVARRTAR